MKRFSSIILIKKRNLQDRTSAISLEKNAKPVKSEQKIGRK